MLKYLVYCLLLWQAMSVMSAKIGVGKNNKKIPCTSDDEIAAEKKNKSNQVLTPALNFTDPNAKYNFLADNQVFNLNDITPYVCPPCTCTCTITCKRAILGSDYVETSEKAAFKLHLRQLPWNRARRICAEEGGHLAVPESDEEETEILKMMLKESVDHAWLGIHDQFEEGDWVTVLDEPLGKSGWAKWSKLYPNNPDNDKGNQNCALLMRNGGGMDDEACNQQKSFVCKISKA